MPTQPCNQEKKIAQTLFLGASVANFNVSLGWGSQSSQLTVNLVEDKVSPYCDDYGKPIVSQFPLYKGGSIPTNHYHDCLDDACYMTKDGAPFDSNKYSASERMTLGKVFYKVFSSPPVVPQSGKTNCVLSEYWFNPDPGFLGIQNRINLDGSYINIFEKDNTNINPGYDIINCPVFFKAGDFSFGGIVQSWTRNQSSSGDSITVTIEDMKSVLSNCYIILDKFSGAIFSKISGSENFYGAPRNWVGDKVDYFGRLYNGNIPNVFNIYGFLESFAYGGFGGANKNANGISVNSIVDSLSVLTGNTFSAPSTLFVPLQAGYAPKSAFSPFCRILTKTPQTTDTFQNVSPNFNSFGIIPPTVNYADNVNRCQFVLDLSELPRFSDDFRISDPVMTITDFITRITEESGYDFTVDLNPISSAGILYNVIKLKLVSRNNQPIPNQIQNTVNRLLCDGYSVSSADYGKEKNNTNLKSVVIGANQQRLLQVRSNRLGYTQSNLVFNSKTMQFINYDTLGNNPTNTYRFHHGKYRMPSAFSTNNPDLSKQINPGQSDLYDSNEIISNDIAGNDFSSIDTGYADAISSPIPKNCGNYYGAVNIPQDDPIESNDPGNYFDFNTDNIMGNGFRFFPMFKDAICPFFGYVRDEEVKVDPKKNTDLRKIRPVYLDTWTGQICVLIETHEFPQVSIPIVPTIVSAGKSYILISESEIRAALAGFDNFLVYSLAKVYRPDLIESLRLGHRNKYYNKLLSEGISPTKAADMAEKKYDWFWRQIHGNIAGPFGQPVEIAPAKNDGSSYIDQQAMQDLQLLHQYVNQIGSYYGKQYMVSLPNMKSYKDAQYADITLPTVIGDCYVFRGGGEVFYNYQPISEGAWEEPGNVIDDTIAVGGSNYYALAEDDGRIGTILGYNSNRYFDYTKSEMCKFASELYYNNLGAMDDQKINPAWSYQIFDEILNLRETQCPDSGFIFNSINISSLPTTDYINIDYGGGSQAQDAWAYSIPNESLRKLYVKAQLDPKISYIDSENLFFPKAIVVSPGLSLNTSSSQYKKDPNRTVITNVSSEDLILYLKTTAKKYWDYEFIAYLLYYVSPVFQNIFKGNYAVSSDESANHVEIAPKAAHPYFAGIPIRLNTFVYGPWANNVYVDYLRDPQSVFPDGQEIKLSDTLPYTCTTTNISVNNDAAKNLIDNFIGPMSVEVDDQLAPWNYGGSAYMDQIANIKAYSQLNYQNIIETAQIKMPGLPIFDLGSDFDISAVNFSKYDFNTVIGFNTYSYVDSKYTGGSFLEDFKEIGLPNKLVPKLLSVYNPGTDSAVTAVYNTIRLDTPIAKPSTVITNIQLSIGSDGIYTTYSLRTYTKKLSLFNKTEIDRIAKQGKEKTERNKQLAGIKQQNINVEVQQYKAREDKRLNESNSYFDSIGFSSKLFGWSPTSVLIGQASPYLKTLNINPDYISKDSLYVKPQDFGSQGSNSRDFSLPYGEKSIGDDDKVKDSQLLQNVSTFIPTIGNTLKYKTDVGMYEMKEIRAQLDQDYGMQSAMSLDGLLSPISFFPTHKHSTYSYTKYDIDTCPFCRGTKKIKTEYKIYTNASQQSGSVEVYCEYCERKDKKLKYKLSAGGGSTASSETLPPYIVTNLSTSSLLAQFKGFSSGSSQASSSNSGGSASINLISLNPILVGDGEFRNPNTQNYAGEHPDGKHDKLTIGGKDRPFFDRCRHSIEIVARGSIPQQHFTITDNAYEYIDGYQPDFHSKDLKIQDELSNRDTGSIPLLKEYQMNQRFLGLRGPLTMHAWGYDEEGYPVPNAADEPLSVDQYGRPLRFKLKVKSKTDTAYGDVSDGAVYYFNSEYRVKGEEDGKLPEDKDKVTVYVYENDLTQTGYMSTKNYSADRTEGYQGDIVSKTQKDQDGTYTEKVKLNDFYLNYGERPDLWPVGPIDLRWDSSRNVWTVPSNASMYKMVYVTLEEDMIKPALHYDETFAARGYLDELEYTSEPLPNGSRRLVYVKDKSGWTAPRGAKFLCRYDTSSGFYEPVSKPSFTVVGNIINAVEANITMHYVQGKRAGSIPTMKVSFNNKLNLPIVSGKNGFFNYDGGEWILISIG